MLEIAGCIGAMSTAPDSHRTRLAQLAEQHGHSLRVLSLRLGRNAAYLQQHVTRGSPRHLDADDRLALAQLFQVDERELGARDPWRPGK